MNPLIRIGIIGDFDSTSRYHIATNESLQHAARALGYMVDCNWLPTPFLDGSNEAVLGEYDGLLCAPGSPYQSMTGALRAIRFAREHDRPFIGT
jgi:CTP synthase (UTP-ammonia lyase)